MPTPMKKEKILLGAIIALFCLAVPINAGGSSRFYGFAIATG